MSVFVSYDETPDERYTWNQMARKTVIEPPLDPESDDEDEFPIDPEDPPVQGTERIYEEVKDVLIQDSIPGFEYRTFPALCGIIDWSNNNNVTESNVTPYGRYGYRFTKDPNVSQAFYYSVPYWYDPSLPDRMLWFQVGVQVEDRLRNGRLWTQMDTDTGIINSVLFPQYRVDPDRSNFPFGYNILSEDFPPKFLPTFMRQFESFQTPQVDSLINILPVKLIRGNLTPGLNRIKIQISNTNNPKTMLFHMFNTVFPTNVSFAQRNINPQEGYTVNHFRLGELSRVPQLDFRYSAGGNQIYPLDLFEQSEDNENWHAIVLKNNSDGDGITSWTPPPSHFVDLQWPCSVAMLGIGNMRFVDASGAQSVPANGNSARFDGTDGQWSGGHMYPSPQTVGFRAFKTGGSGFIYTAITYIYRDGEKPAGDRNLKFYKRNVPPNDRWQQGLGAVDWRSFVGEPQKHATVVDSPTRWIRP